MRKRPRPNLFLIGAMKSGTSSMHQYLSEHPQIFMSANKEPAYFSKEENWHQGEKWYLPLFEDAGSAKIIGESSTHYTKLPTSKGVPDRISNFSPNAKFIYLMRDPVRRCISQYWHHYQGRRPGEIERQDMLSAFQKDERYVAYSNYAMQLQPYFDLFGPDHFFTLTLEEFQQNPADSMQKIYDWLGVDSKFKPGCLEHCFHKTHTVVTRRIGWLHQFRTSSFWGAIRKSIPDPIRKFGVQFSERSAIDTTSISTDEVVAYLRPILQPCVKELELMLKRDFPEWTTLWNTEEVS